MAGPQTKYETRLVLRVLFILKGGSISVNPWSLLNESKGVAPNRLHCGTLHRTNRAKVNR